MDKSNKFVTVSYPNHHQVFTERIWNLYTSKRKIDLNLFTDGKPNRIGVHQLIVELFIPRITELLQARAKGSLDAVGSHSSILPYLDMTDHSTIYESASGLQLLIELIYRGALDSVTADQVKSLKKIADDLQVPIEIVESGQPSKQSDPEPVEEPSNSRAPKNKRKGRPRKIVASSSWSLEPSSDQAPTLKIKKNVKTAISNYKFTRQKANAKNGRQSKTLAKTKSGASKDSDSTDQSDKNSQSDDDGSTKSSSDFGDTAQDSEGAVRKNAKRSATLSKKRKKSVDANQSDTSASEADAHDSSSDSSTTPEDIAQKKTQKPPPKKRRKTTKAGKTDTTTEAEATPLTKSGKVSRAGYTQKWRQSQPVQRCTHCPYQTHDKFRLLVHINAKHDPSVFILKCRVCRRPFQTELALERHERTHESDKDIYQCEHCEYSSPKRVNYFRHLITIHKISTDGETLEERFRCEHCDFACVYKSQFNYHMETRHVTEKQFKCEQCPYASARKADLAKHVGLVHLGGSEHRIICDICGYRCMDRGFLNRHLRTHTGERPYICNICGKAYAYANKLKTHMESHEGIQKRFTCHLCGHQCSRKDNLLVHLRSCSTRVKPVPGVMN